uniref:Uncharacterized protein n=1 Tax=Oryza nivara TaxID=4536 RepID=A0A0E0IAH3_ORYNI
MSRRGGEDEQYPYYGSSGLRSAAGEARYRKSRGESGGGSNDVGAAEVLQDRTTSCLQPSAISSAARPASTTSTRQHNATSNQYR